MEYRMPELSAYELAHRISVAKPEPEHAAAAKATFVASGGEEMDASDDAGSMRGALALLRRIAPEGVTNSSLVYASSFVLAGTEAQEREDLGDSLLARHVLALASHRESDGSPFDLKTAAQSGGIPADRAEAVRDSVFDATHVSDESLAALSGHPLFSAPSVEDEMFASKVLSSDRASLSEDSLAMKASMAIEALDIDVSGPDAARLPSALARLAGDRTAVEASVPDIAVRMASDVAAQARAERLAGDLGMDETSEEAFRIHEAAARDPRIAEDLSHEAKGRFHEMSRGSMIELRSDMESGANLPGDMGRFIRLSAERIEGMEAPAAGREPVRMQNGPAEQGMGI